jgi:hypothetical protein
MPAGQGKDAERFAAAVEQGTPPGLAGDDDLARELEIVAMLRSSGPAYAPDPEAKARAKQRLMAMFAAEHGEGGPRPPVAPPTPEETTAPMGRIVEAPFPTPRSEIDTAAESTTMAPVTERQPVADAETDDAAETSPTAVSTSATAHAPAARPGRRAKHSVASRPAGRARAARRPAPSMRRRAVLVGSAALLAIFALTGGGLLASKDALPGDNLYALKRAAESAELALTFDETARAQRHLEMAATRLSEVEQLVAREPAKAPDPQVISSAIEGFDTSTDEGSRLLITAAEQNGNTTGLDTLHTWVSQQVIRLTELRPSLPLPAAGAADDSIQLLDVLRGRTEALGARPLCSGESDEGDCTPRSVTQQGPGGSDSDETDSPSSPDARTPGPSGTEAPSGTPSETPGGGPLLELPDLGGNGNNNSDEDESDGDGSSRESDAPPPGGGAGDGVNVPLPLVPPITLPPLVPGMPPITIG